MISKLEKGLMIMNSQIPEFTELPPDLKFPDIKVEDVCPLLAEIVIHLEKWSPESYGGYHLGCAIGGTSIISARRVQYHMGGLRSTNLNVILVGHTGLSAKTTVLNLIKDLIRTLSLDHFLLPDTITAQKLFSDMCLVLPEDFEKMEVSEQENIIRKIQKTMAFSGQRGWVFDEFGMFLREMTQNSHYNATFHELFKKFDDNSPTMGNSTHKRGNEFVHLPFLTIIGAMTPADLLPHAKKGAALWGDGFFSRMVFICPPDDFRKDEPFPDGERLWPKEILVKLKTWHEGLGTPKIKYSEKIEVIPAPGQLVEIPKNVKDAHAAYRVGLKDIIQTWDDDNKDLAGNYIRFPDIAMRIAVLLTSLDNRSEVTLSHWAYAQNFTEDRRIDLHRLYYQSLSNHVSKNNNSIKDPIERIHELIKNKGYLTSREIQSLTHFKNKTVEPLLDLLLENGKIIKIPFGKTFKFVDNSQ